MRRCQGMRVAVALTTWVLLWIAPVWPSSATQRDWTVQDSVTLRRFVTQWDTPLALWGDDPLRISPTGRYFAVGTHQADFGCDCNRFELLVYSSDAVNRALAEGSASAPKPVHTIRMSSTSPAFFSSGGIRDVVWHDDDTLLFSGTGEGRENLNYRGPATSVYRFDMRTGALTQLTDAAHDAQIYDYHRASDLIVYLTRTYSGRLRDEAGIPEGLNHYPLQPMRGVAHRGGIAPYLTIGAQVNHVGIFMARGGEKPRVIRPLRQTYLYPGNEVRPRVSPDGHWAIVGEPLEPGEAMPAGWSQYGGLDVPLPLMAQQDVSRQQRLMLVDTTTGEQRPLWQLPLGPRSSGVAGSGWDVRWSPDSRRVLLMNVSVPLSADEPDRRRLGYLVEVEIATGRWSVVEPTGRPTIVPPAWGWPGVVPAVYTAQWVTGSQFLVQRTDATTDMYKLGDRLLYTAKGGRWTSKRAPAPTASPGEQKRPTLLNGLTVALRGNANQPPALVASNGARELTLLAADERLADIWRAPAQEVQWTERGGHVEKGGLMLPREGRWAPPYPLVVQIGSYDPQQFRTEGESATAFAAQALVARGFAVLDINGNPSASYAASFKDGAGQPLKWSQAQWLSGPEITERVDAAVDVLAGRGLVDRQRVGLVGFSYTGFLVSYVVTHPGQVTPAAAIVADSGLRNYSEVVANEAAFTGGVSGEHSFAAQDFHRYYGGTFWEEEARKRWLQHAPAFSVNRVETPTLFVYNRNLGAEADFLTEMIGAFRVNDREMDLLMIPNSDHQLARPRQREASMQATLEWMSFWLLGSDESRPESSAAGKAGAGSANQETTGTPEVSPEKAEQYWYWRHLREHKAARQAAAAAASSKGAP